MLLDTDPDPLPRDAVSDWDAVDVGDGPDSVDLVVETANMLSIVVAQQLERVDALRCEALAQARIRGVRSPEIAERSLRLEVAAALRCSEYAAGELIARAQALVHRFPQMLESLSRAQTTDRHTKLFVEAMAAVEPEFHDRTVPRAVALAEVEPVGTFRRSLRRLIETVRAESLAARHEAALVGRRVVVEDSDDGMAWLMLHAPAVEVHAIHARLTKMAKAIASSRDESRTLDQLRADVAGDLLVDGDTTQLAPEARGIRATVAVTVPALALLGSADASSGGSAMVEGLGPVPIDRAQPVRWSRRLDASPHPPRDRCRRLGGTRSLPTST
jgi:hypothetical protein